MSLLPIEVNLEDKPKKKRVRSKRTGTNPNRTRGDAKKMLKTLLGKSKQQKLIERIDRWGE